MGACKSKEPEKKAEVPPPELPITRGPVVPQGLVDFMMKLDRSRREDVLNYAWIGDEEIRPHLLQNHVTLDEKTFRMILEGNNLAKVLYSPTSDRERRSNISIVLAYGLYEVFSSEDDLTLELLHNDVDETAYDKMIVVAPGYFDYNDPLNRRGGSIARDDFIRHRLIPKVLIKAKINDDEFDTSARIKRIRELFRVPPHEEQKWLTNTIMKYHYHIISMSALGLTGDHGTRIPGTLDDEAYRHLITHAPQELLEQFIEKSKSLRFAYGPYRTT